MEISENNNVIYQIDKNNSWSQETNFVPSNYILSGTKLAIEHLCNKYIDDYIDSKKVKKKSRKEGILEGTLDKLDEEYKTLTDDILQKRRDNAAEHSGKGIIENYIKRKLGK